MKEWKNAGVGYSQDRKWLTNIGSMLGRCRRRRPSIEPVLIVMLCLYSVFTCGVPLAYMYRCNHERQHSNYHLPHSRWVMDDITILMRGPGTLRLLLSCYIPLCSAHHHCQWPSQILLARPRSLPPILKVCFDRPPFWRQSRSECIGGLLVAGCRLHTMRAQTCDSGPSRLLSMDLHVLKTTLYLSEPQYTREWRQSKHQPQKIITDPLYTVLCIE